MPSSSTTITLSEYRKAARLTRALTAFGSFAELLTARGLSPAGYRPVLYTSLHPARPRRRRTPEQLAELSLRVQHTKLLADLYDRAQQARGDIRRAVRL